MRNGSRPYELPRKTFALVAAIALAACNEDVTNVHATANARSQDCVSCHRSAFQATTSPSHVSGTFPETCNTCHNTNAWVPATVIDHKWFTLDGAHAGTPCTTCHAGTPTVWAGTPKDCVGCHLANYKSSPYPTHNTFPQTCGDCHNTTDWAHVNGGIHPENKFPINTGVHSNAGISACADCHIASLGSPVKGANTDCIHCHLGAHNQPAIDAAHASLGAQYPGANASSPHFCLSCHPSG
jgi:hypothetical protein